MVWLMNVPRGDLGKKFNVEGATQGEPVIFARNEPGMDHDGSNLVGIYADNQSEVAFVPVDLMNMDQVRAATDLNALLHREAA